jgi:predicted Zn finger-like uncharacterized protein
MPRITCPTCGSVLQVTDDMIGGDVQCGNCQAVFVAREGRPSGRTSPPSRRPTDEEDRPSRRGRRDEDEGVDDRPSRRSRRRDDEDEDDEPRPRRQAGKTNGLAIASMVLGIIAIVIEIPSLATSLFGVVCCCAMPLAWIGHAIGALAAVIGLILGIAGLKPPGKGMAIAGLITSGLSLLCALAGIVLSVLGIAIIGAAQPNNPGFNQPNNPPFNQPNRPNPRR